MEFYRRPLFTYSIILLLLAVQPLIHLYYQSSSKCVRYALTTLAYEAIVNHTDIVNLNTRILCWIPTTLKRLDRALIAYELGNESFNVNFFLFFFNSEHGLIGAIIRCLSLLAHRHHLQ